VCCAYSAAVCATVWPYSVPCAGPLRVAVAVAVADTRSGATRGACIATRIALPTVQTRPISDNIYDQRN